VVFTATVGLVLVCVFVFAYREIQLVLLNRDLAQVLGVPVDAIMTGMFVLLGIGIATALRLVGALLVDAIILLPAMAALRFARNFGMALVLSSLFGLTTTIGGFLVALFFDLPVGASAAMVSTLLLAISMLIARVASH
jgi:ABC-type Mn2+/Zn2+ transport system permease subunit